jgi:hypothetical protein
LGEIVFGAAGEEEKETMNYGLLLRIFDVEHGACAMLGLPGGGLAMIDCGHNESTGWRPSEYIRYQLGLTVVDHLFVQNGDNDHVSDLPGLGRHGVNVGILHRNPSHGPDVLRALKTDGTTPAIERFIAMCGEYTAPVPVPTQPWPGVTYMAFWNRWPWVWKTNDLSLVVFIKYGPFKILFPGDLEKAGWENLLKLPSFRQELVGTTILVASHHGRENGLYDEIFNYFTPAAVVISDKPMAHETQDCDYRPFVSPFGVRVVNQTRRRHVLTTRRDGDILFRVQSDGQYFIHTEKDWYSSLRAA